MSHLNRITPSKTGFQGTKTWSTLNNFLSMAPKTALDSRDYKFLSYAEQASRLSSRNRHRVGCVITQKNDVVSQGFNTDKTHPFQARWNQYSSSLHAEIAALLSAMKNPGFNPERCTVYVSRYTRRGFLGCSYPCRSCWAALEHIGVQRIVCYDEQDRPTKICLK